LDGRAHGRTRRRKSIRNYLLGQLDEVESQQLEDNVFTDREFFDTALMVEDELIEDFVFEILPATDKEDFISHFLSTPERILKVQTTIALKHYSDSDLVATPPTRLFLFETI